MKNVLAFGSSNSKSSINKILATYTAKKIGNASLTIIDLSDFELPIYGVDLEAEIGIPEKVKELDDIIRSMDGIVLSLAEHNGSYTAVFKNTLDWLSRIETNVWKGKPMLLLATSPGARGAATVLNTAKTSFPFLGGKVIADFSLPAFFKNFIDNDITKPELKDELEQKIHLFEQEIN